MASRSTAKFRIDVDIHDLINETPMLEQDEHFKHLNENPTYIRPEDWHSVDGLIDWIIEKNKAWDQMVKIMLFYASYSTFGRTISKRSVVRVYCIPPMRPIGSSEFRSSRPSFRCRSSM